MKLFYLTTLILLTICFMSCDGRDRLDRTPQEVLQENKLLDSFSEMQIRLIPEEYAEKTTDTIFSNGYEVHVKMYTDMDNHITVNLNGETVNYRDFNLDIIVVKDGKKLMNKTFSKQHHMVHETTILNLKSSYLRDFWISVDDKHYLDQNMPVINFEYYSPVSKETEVMSVVALEDRYDFYTN